MPYKKGAAAKPPTHEMVQTPLGTVEYTLTRKKVRNLNLRVRADGTVVVSAPLRMPLAQVETFLTEKSGWIARNRQMALQREPEAPCPYTKEECLALFAPISEAIYPLFADLLKGQPPVLKVRDMKTRWGTCNLRTCTITLNMRLAQKPRALQEYVILHEYVHFLHPHHQPPFHAEMSRLMPDYKIRRKMLRG